MPEVKHEWRPQREPGEAGAPRTCNTSRCSTNECGRVTVRVRTFAFGPPQEGFGLGTNAKIRDTGPEVDIGRNPAARQRPANPTLYSLWVGCLGRRCAFVLQAYSTLLNTAAATPMRCRISFVFGLLTTSHHKLKSRSLQASCLMRNHPNARSRHSPCSLANTASACCSRIASGAPTSSSPQILENETNQTIRC